MYDMKLIFDKIVEMLEEEVNKAKNEGANRMFLDDERLAMWSVNEKGDVRFFNPNPFGVNETGLKFYEGREVFDHPDFQPMLESAFPDYEIEILSGCDYDVVELTW